MEKNFGKINLMIEIDFNGLANAAEKELEAEGKTLKTEEAQVEMLDAWVNSLQQSIQYSLAVPISDTATLSDFATFSIMKELVDERPVETTVAQEEVQ